MKVWYLCDGERPECAKRTCFKNGGTCKHTRDIEHAVNFKKEKRGEHVNYKENQP